MSRRPIVLINAEQWRSLLNEAIDRYPFETGGIIMGTWLADGTAIIADVIGPGPSAEHTRSSFDPDQEWQEQQTANIWTHQSGRVEYLGDWHTHPNGSTRPSRRDHGVALTIASSTDARAPKPIILIISISTNGTIRTSAQALTGRRLRRASLSLQTADI